MDQTNTQTTTPSTQPQPVQPQTGNPPAAVPPTNTQPTPEAPQNKSSRLLFILLVILIIIVTAVVIIMSTKKQTLKTSATQPNPTSQPTASEIISPSPASVEEQEVDQINLDQNIDADFESIDQDIKQL